MRKEVTCWLAGAVWLSSFAAASAAGDTRLADAVERKEFATASTLIGQKVDVNEAQPDGGTALHWAAHWDALDVAQQLLAHDADANTVNEYGVSPLFLAARNGSPRMVRTLLDAGARADAVLPTGVTVLMEASRTGNVEVVTLLLARGADANQRQQSKGQTALMWAVAERHAAIARLLIDHGADVQAQTDSGFTALMFAARQGDMELAQLLLDRGADINRAATDGSTSLLVATVRGHVTLALFLLERGADPDGDLKAAGYTPLHWTAGKSETFTTFNYPDAPGEWAVLAGIPATEDRLTLLKALIAHGADPNARIAKQPPRFGVSDGSGHAPIGASPLLLAAFSGDTESMRVLVAHGADPFTKANDDSTPLMAAAGMIAQRDETTRVTEPEFLEAVKVLLEFGLPLEAANRRGYRAMHYAAAAGFTSILKYLAQQGANINAKAGAEGVTPLSIASGTTGTLYHERPEAAVVLRELGATH